MEIDLLKPLVPFVSIMGHLQPVEYEGLYQIYFGCGMYMHMKKDYLKLAVNTNNPPVTITSNGTN